MTGRFKKTGYAALGWSTWHCCAGAAKRKVLHRPAPKVKTWHKVAIVTILGSIAAILIVRRRREVRTIERPAEESVVLLPSADAS